MSSQNLGTKTARNPSSIQNNQNHEPSHSQRGMNAVPGTIQAIVPDATVQTTLDPFTVLWVVNRDAAAPHYLAIGKDSSLPAGAVTATTGMAIPAGQGLLITCGASDDDKQSMACKADSTQIHITILGA